MISVYVAPGAQRWAIAPAVRQALSSWTARQDVQVHYWPRAQLGEVWRCTHGGRDVPTSRPYAFRAWANANVVHILVDETETPESIVWLTLHELAHVELGCAPLIAQAYRSIPKHPDYLSDDAAHDERPEEQMADLVADQLAPLLGSRAGYGRRWWRPRTEAALARGRGGAMLTEER